MNTMTSSLRKVASPAASVLTLPLPAFESQAWFWRTATQWMFLSAWPFALVVLLQAPLFNFWQWTLSTWSHLLGMPHLSVRAPGMAWSPLDDGSFVPSNIALGLTFGALTLIWLGTSYFSDRLHPLKVTLRALCLIQLTACLFFAVSPADFPYNISAHLHALLTMGYGFMLAIPPMLALGLGILKLPWYQKLLAPLSVLAYFALMLPHKFVLHAWLLERGSILFMPLLFFGLGSLLDLWIFIALYAWLASMAPVQVLRARSPHA